MAPNTPPMSILSDLDPRNNRFIDRPPPRKRSKITWVLALVPLLGAAFLTLALRPAANEAELTNPAPVVGPSAAPEAPPAPTKSMSVAPEKHADAAARILVAAQSKNTGPAEESTGANAFQAIQQELDKPTAAISHPASVPPTAKASPTKKPRDSGKPAASTASVRKANRGNDSPRSARSTNQSAERDIDIITAIVR